MQTALQIVEYEGMAYPVNCPGPFLEKPHCIFLALLPELRKIIGEQHEEMTTVEVLKGWRIPISVRELKDLIGETEIKLEDHLDAARTDITYLSGADDMDLINLLKQDRRNLVLSRREAETRGFRFNRFLTEQGFNYIVVESKGGEVEESPLPPGIFPAGTNESAEEALNSRGLVFTRLNQMDFYENGFLEADKSGISSEATVEMDQWNPTAHLLESMKAEMTALDGLKATSGKSVYDEGVIVDLDKKDMTPKEEEAWHEREIRWLHVEDFFIQMIRWCETGWGPEVESYLNVSGVRVFQFTHQPYWGKDGIQFSDWAYNLSVKLQVKDGEVDVIPDVLPFIQAGWHYLWEYRHAWMEEQAKKDYPVFECKINGKFRQFKSWQAFQQTAAGQSFTHPKRIWKQKPQVWLSETPCLHLIRFAFKFLLEHYGIPKRFWPRMKEEPRAARITQREERLLELQLTEAKLLDQVANLTNDLLDPELAQEAQRQAMELTRKFDKNHENIAISESQLEYEVLKLAREMGFDLGVGIYDVNFTEIEARQAEPREYAPAQEFNLDDYQYIYAMTTNQILASDGEETSEIME